MNNLSARRRPRFGAFLGIGALVLAGALASCDQSKPSASAATNATGAPKLVVVGGDSVNWGETAPGKLTHTLKVTNGGGGVLMIDTVLAACGCTTAPIDKKELKPGDTGSIDVAVDLPNGNGPVRKTITIRSNDTTRKEAVVSLIATFVNDIVAVPNFFQPITRGKAGREDSTSIVLTNTGKGPVTVQAPQLAEAAEMVVRFEPSTSFTMQPGDSVRVVAHVKPLKDGSSASSKVIFKTDSKLSKEVSAMLTTTAVVGQ